MIPQLHKAAWTLISALILTACASSPPEEQKKSPDPASPPTKQAPEPAKAPEAPKKPDRKIAVTIDDLPLAAPGGYTNDAHRLKTVKMLCEVLKKHKVPAMGFFNMRGANPDLLTVWKACPVAFGNHTMTHPSADKIPIAKYLKDLEDGHRAVSVHVPEGTRIPFRSPYLREGFDPSVKAAIRDKLKALDSPFAPVTIDTLDWWYAVRWSKAARAGDETVAERYRQAWMWNMEETTIKAEMWSRELFDREPPQILLIHGNEINAHHLGAYFEWLEARGYTFVTLEEALKDPAYQEVDTTTSPTGDDHWLRLRRSRAQAEGSP